MFASKEMTSTLSVNFGNFQVTTPGLVVLTTLCGLRQSLIVGASVSLTKIVNRHVTELPEAPRAVYSTTCEPNEKCTMLMFLGFL